MILDDLRSYIISQGGSFTTENTFIDVMPDIPTNSIMLARSEGGEFSDDGYLKYTPIVILIRNSTYSGAEDFCEELNIMLHNKTYLASSIKYMYITEDISEVGVGEKNEVILQMVFEVITIEA